MFGDGFTVVVSPLPRFGDAKEYSMSVICNGAVFTKNLRVSGAVTPDREEEEIFYQTSLKLREIQVEQS